MDNHQAPAATAMHLNVKAVQNQRAAIINKPEFRERTSMLGAEKESSSLNVICRREKARALQGPESTHGVSSTKLIYGTDLFSTDNASECTRRSCKAQYELFFDGWRGSRRQHDGEFSPRCIRQSKNRPTCEEAQDCIFHLQGPRAA